MNQIPQSNPGIGQAQVQQQPPAAPGTSNQSGHSSSSKVDLSLVNRGIWLVKVGIHHLFLGIFREHKSQIYFANQIISTLS